MVGVDEGSVKKATETLEVILESGEVLSFEVPITITDLDKVNDAIEAIPTEKMLEIKLQGEIDTQLEIIKATAETAQKAFEWTAKLDIAEVEAQADIIQSAYDSINVAIGSTADLIGAALESLGDPGSLAEKWAAGDILREEIKLREQTFELQKKLTEAEIEHITAKTELLATGQSLITIDSSGLEPALEMVMWHILEKIQLRATESASDFLLGLGT